MVEADWCIGIPERPRNIKPGVVGGWRVRSVKFAPIEAAVHVDQGMSPDGVDGHRKEYVSRDEPCDHEDSKHDIANRLVTQVFQTLGELRGFG